MEFINDLKKNLSGTAKDVKKKSSDIVEITRLTISIAADEEKIKKLIYELGSDVYASFGENCNCATAFETKCNEIKKLEDAIKKNREKILILRGSIECHSCKAVIEKDSNFCPKCGAKILKDLTVTPVSEEDGE